MKSLNQEMLETDNIYYYVNQVIDQKEGLKVRFDKTKKGHLFALGLAFASESIISSVNYEDFNLEGPKSFEKMLYIWWKNSLVPVTANLNYENRAFVICPVRDAAENVKMELKNKVSQLEKEGLQVHYPSRDTNQEDSYGYRICLDNANAISNARNIYIYYDKDSKGSMFDLGVAYYHQMKHPERTITILNEDKVDFNSEDLGINILKSMQKMQELYTKTNNTRKRV